LSPTVKFDGMGRSIVELKISKQPWTCNVDEPSDKTKVESLIESDPATNTRESESRLSLALSIFAEPSQNDLESENLTKKKVAA
jgi:hypothetical protein